MKVKTGTKKRASGNSVRGRGRADNPSGEVVRPKKARVSPRGAWRKSGSRQDLFFREFHGIVFEGRLDFTPLFFHGAVEEITGYTEAELAAGEPTWDRLIHPQDLPKIRESMEKIRLVPGFSATREYRIVRKDGRSRWVQEFIQNVCDDSGKPVLVQGAMFDITERKGMEDTVRRQADLLKKTFDSMADAIFILDAKCPPTIIDCNDAVSAVFGHEKRELRGKDTRVLHVDADSLRRFREILDPCVASGKPACHIPSFRMRRKDGSVFPSEHFVSQLTDDAGRGIGWVSVVRDVSERVRAEEALRENEEKYRALFHNAGVSIATLALDGTIEAINSTGAGTLGGVPADFEGKSAYEVFPEIKGRAETRIARLLKTGKGGDYEDAAALPSGQLHFQTHFEPVRDSAGAIRAVQLVTLDITDRKRAELELRAGEGKLREQAGFLENILESLGHPFHVIDADTHRIVLANSAARAAYGMRADKEATCYAATHGRSRPCHESGEDCPLETVKRTGKPATAEHIHKTAGGGPRFVEVQAYPLRDKSGKITQVIEYAIDITVRKRAEQFLRWSEKELRVRDQIADVFLTASDEEMYSEVLRVILKATGSEYGIFGYIDEDGALVCPSLTGAAWDACAMPGKSAVFSPDQWGGVWGKALKEKTLQCSNDALHVPEGHVPIARALAAPVVHQGASIGLIMVANRKTDYRSEDRRLAKSSVDKIAPVLHARLARLGEEKQRRRAEASLKETEKIINMSPAVVFLWRNAEGWPVELVTENVKELFGYTAEEFMSGKVAYAKVVHPEDLDTVGEEVARHSAEAGREDFVHVPYRIVTKDGQTRWVDDRTHVRRDAGGAVTHYQGVVVDITESKHAEEALLSAQKIESLGVMAGGIAHDFNNILTGILGNISLARECIDDPVELRELLKETENAAQDAKSLSQQLLTFAKGGKPIKKALRVGPLLADAAGFVMRGTSSRCEFRIDDDLRPVEADPGQLAQVVHNLMINALQAMPGGGVVTVGAENVRVSEGDALPLPGGEYLRISVRDAGVGIPEAQLPKIFDPYYSTKQKGRGLGLATTRSIVLQHGGHIAVESKPDEGTTFTFYLPAASATDVPRDTGPAGVKRGSGRVLVMDDEPVVVRALTRMLKQMGYEAASAPDGERAVEAYKRAKDSGAPFDAVIMDLTIPGGMGGQEAVRRLAELEPGVKAIVSSGYSNDPIMSDFADSGFAGVLPKPYKMEDVSDVLSRVIGSSVKR
ncbi:MAG: PAS domain S-box protein [Elusimicrobiota bacterium]